MTSKDYGQLIVKRKWLALIVGLLFTVFWIGGLSGLSMNPDNRIFFSKDNPQLLALETLEKTYSRDDNVYLVLAASSISTSLSIVYCGFIDQA